MTDSNSEPPASDAPESGHKAAEVPAHYECGTGTQPVRIHGDG